jgi:hypothetical protein
MLANAQKDDDILEVSKRGLDELQSDLDECLKEYNTERSHSGKYCYAKTRLQTFLDSKGLAQDKMSDRTLTSSSDIQSQRAEPETERSHAERSAGGRHSARRCGFKPACLSDQVSVRTVDTYRHHPRHLLSGKGLARC